MICCGKLDSRTAPERFTVLCVCRFYARKRVDLLLRAAAMLRGRIPELEIRIVGGGMEEARFGAYGVNCISNRS